MLTLRKMFSRSFAISATRGPDTGTTLVTAFWYSACASAVQVGVTPPTSFGVLAT